MKFCQFLMYLLLKQFQSITDVNFCFFVSEPLDRYKWAGDLLLLNSTDNSWKLFLFSLFLVYFLQ